MKSHIRSRLHVLVWCLLMSVAALVVATHGANAAEAPTLTLSRSSATYLENDAGFFVDGDLSITGYSGNIDGARVFIDRGYRSAEDSLQFTPSGGINGSFQSSTGILTLSGSASASAYQTVLRSVRYVNGSDNPTTTNRLITVALTGGTMYYATNGHYYEFVSNPGVSWTSAKSEAANRTLYGLRGYLATITSSGENAFLTEKVSGSAWIGASDADQEGVWKWMTGPETGTTLSYTNWNSGEPNNSGGNENYAHMMSWTSPPGMWNDLPNAGGSGQYASTGYMVEYGGMSGDPVVQLSGTVTVSVQSVNDPPRIAAGSTLTITEDSGTTQRNVIAPTDPDSSIPSLTYHIGSPPTKGTVSIARLSDGSTGQYSYRPYPNANGADSFTWYVNDGQSDSNVVTQSVSITPVNDVPSFTKGSNQTVLEDCGLQTLAGWATNISAGPPDEAGQTLTFIVTGTTNPALFSAGPAVASNGTLTYTPAPDANGTATVTVILQDNGGTANGGVDSSASQAFTITMTPVNDAASFTRGADQTVLEDCGPQTVTPWATAISAGPPDEAGQTLTFTVTSTTNPALFRVAPAVAPDGTLTFTPAPDANGSATITVILQDNGGTANGGIDTSVPQTFTISVTPVNDAPVVSAPPLVATLEDRPVSIFGITVTDVDINETPAPNNTVRVTLTVSHGTLSMSALTGLNFSVGHGTADRSMTFIGTLTNANMALGTLSYVPDQNYNNYIGAGLEVCLVTVSDMAHTGSGGNRVALKPICISVTPANDAPVALDATWTLTGDAVFSQVLQATDIDSAFLTYVIVSPPSHGLVTITGVSSGDFTYTPTPSYCGLDTFTFKVLDESLESNVATVVLAIHPAAVAVTFDTQGGSAVPPQTVAYGSCLVEPSVPTKAGMTFAGWYTDPADGTRWDVSAPVTTDLTLYAHWTVLTFTVTPSAGDHGMISPATVQTVPYGSTVTFTIAPDPGYQIADVQVDGVSVGAVASYMFQSVMADHTIHATFAPLGSLSLAAGWNLVAVPVPLPASSIPGLLGAYSYHDGWGVVTSADTLVPGEGYWVEVSAPVPVPLPGVSSPAALSLTYQAGWQLLGNPFDIPLPLASITNGNLITHCYSYSYGPGWGVLSPATDSLQPGRGYWIYLAAPTTLTLLHP